MWPVHEGESTMNRTSFAFALLAAVGFATSANATSLYFQGFESTTNGWIVSTGGDNNGAINRVSSGGGSLGLTAPDGSHYAEVTNDTNGYQAGYGSGGFTYLNGDGVTAPPYPGSSFSQSISIYIDTSLNSNNQEAYWIDMSPSSVSADGVGCDPFACSDEHNFRLTYTGSSVEVMIDGGTSAAYTIGSSGWYTFQDTYAMGATPTSLVNTDMNIFNASNVLLSSTAVLANSDGGTLQSWNLAGPGYIWLPVWQNGFSNNVLGIDDVRADAADVPEAPTLALFAAAMLLAAGLRSRKTKA